MSQGASRSRCQGKEAGQGSEEGEESGAEGRRQSAQAQSCQGCRSQGTQDEDRRRKALIQLILSTGKNTWGRG